MAIENRYYNYFKNLWQGHSWERAGGTGSQRRWRGIQGREEVLPQLQWVCHKPQGISWVGWKVETWPTCACRWKSETTTETCNKSRLDCFKNHFPWNGNWEGAQGDEGENCRPENISLVKIAFFRGLPHNFHLNLQTAGLIRTPKDRWIPWNSAWRNLKMLTWVNANIAAPTKTTTHPQPPSG